MGVPVHWKIVTPIARAALLDVLISVCRNQRDEMQVGQTEGCVVSLVPRTRMCSSGSIEMSGSGGGVSAVPLYRPRKGSGQAVNRQWKVKEGQ